MKIIAEIGSNWKIDDDCLRSISAAKAAGADIVKFQVFSGPELYGPLNPGTPGLHPEILDLFHECQFHGIEFMCTAFSPRVYEYIDRFVVRHKIASSEITALDILETVASFKKPVLLSTGGATFDQIDQALDILKSCEVTLMYCVAEYPARIVDFRHLDAMKERYGDRCVYGYSDHSTDVLVVPDMARNHGSWILEKHVNFTDHTDTPDAPHSLSGDEFALMVKHLKGDTTLADTFRPNKHQRKMITLPNGNSGYFRPRPGGI